MEHVELVDVDFVVAENGELGGVKRELELPLLAPPPTCHVVTAIRDFSVCGDSEGGVDARATVSHEVENSDLEVVVKGVVSEEHAVVVTGDELPGGREQVVRGEEVETYTRRVERLHRPRNHVDLRIHELRVELNVKPRNVQNHRP